MPSNAAIFLPLVAGFLFLRLFLVTRYVSLRWNGPRLVFWSGTAGVLLLIPTRLLAVHVLSEQEWVDELSRWLQRTAGSETPYLGTLMGTLVFAMVLALALDAGIGSRRATLLTNRWFGDSTVRLLTHELSAGRMVELTLNNGKVYVGLVKELPTLDPHERFVRILPTLSGYRDEARKIHFTTNYYRRVLRDVGRSGTILEKYREADFQVSIRMEIIETMRVFDPDVYEEYFQDESPESGSAGHS